MKQTNRKLLPHWKATDASRSAMPTHHRIAVNDGLFAGHTTVRADVILGPSASIDAVLMTQSAFSAAVVFVVWTERRTSVTVSHVFTQFAVLRPGSAAHRLALFVAGHALFGVRFVQARNHVAARQATVTVLEMGAYDAPIWSRTPASVSAALGVAGFVVPFWGKKWEILSHRLEVSRTGRDVP